MNSPVRLRTLLVVGCGAVVALAMTLWLPWFGTALAVEDALGPADLALVLEGTGASAPDAAEAWRQEGLVRDVVIVEAPIKTHALRAYWSDLVQRGLATPAPTPADHLRIVRAASTDASEQARVSLPAIQAYGARALLVLGGGGIGSRVVQRELASVFQPAGIVLRMVRYGSDAGRDPAHWYQNAEDRRAVLDSWLQLLVPFLSGYQDGT